LRRSSPNSPSGNNPADDATRSCVNSGLINNDPIQRGFCAGMGLKTTLDRYLWIVISALDRYLQYLQHRSARVQARGSTDLGRLAETSGTP
jgi:hypothetical protein